MKLELKHLVGYLPYGLAFDGKRNGWVTFDGNKKILCPVDLDGRWDVIKPILRPLSDLTKDEHFELYMDLCEEIGVVRCEHLLLALQDNLKYAFNLQDLEALEDWMYKNHFDWKYNLIKNGLAIDINII